MRTTVLQPIGAEITDLDSAAAGPEQARELILLLAEHGVLVLRNQQIDDTEFAIFLRLFGDPVFTAGETPLDGHPDLNVISNVGRAQPPRSQFHIDTSYVSHPPAYTALRAVQVPQRGGHTLFSNQYRAYDLLSERRRRQLTGRLVRHVVTGVDPGDAQEHEALHPIFRPHPITGRIALYLSTPQRCVAISGLGTDESAAIIADLCEHSTHPENVYRHAWAPNDLVIWDNGCVMHKADHRDVVGERVMHRGMADGYAAAGAYAALNR